MLENRRPPVNHETYEVGVDELFFSTTDRKGVIEQANSVFVRISRYSWDDLIGAPHNIIRHPDMPGGAFLALWSMLLDGQPSCAYVHNLAADGTTYTVFATMTPLADGFLSVRSRCSTALVGAANAIYDAVRPVEFLTREAGQSAHDAAVAGAREMQQRLSGEGFAGYPEFVKAALPAEVEARAELSHGLPERPDADGVYADVLAAVHRMDDELKEFLAHMGELADTAAQLQSASDQAQAASAEREAAAERIREAASTNASFAPVLMPVNLWVSMSDEMKRELAELTTTLAELQASCTDTRFRLALARLHSDMLGQFAAELIDEVPGHENAAPAMGDLCEAIFDGMEQTETQMARNADLATRAAAKINEATGVLQLPLDLIEAWRVKAAEREDDVVRGLIPIVEEQVDRSITAIAALRELAAKCAAIAEPMRTDAIDVECARIRALVFPTPGRAFAEDDEDDVAPVELTGPRRGM